MDCEHLSADIEGLIRQLAEDGRLPLFRKVGRVFQ